MQTVYFMCFICVKATWSQCIIWVRTFCPRYQL